MKMDDNTYHSLLEIFRSELKEGHNTLVVELLKIDSKSGNDIQNEVQILFRTAHNIKGAAKSVSLELLASIAHQLEDQFSNWRETQKKPNKTEIDTALTLVDDLWATFESSLSKNKQFDESIKVPLSRIEKVNTQFDEFTIFNLKIENFFSELKSISHQFSHLKNENIHLKELKSSIEKLVEKSEHFSSEFSRSLHDIQGNLREIRLVPIDGALEPLRRALYTFSREMKKPVALQIEGADIEIDKVMMDLLRDPLQHLLRNAIDHGIESLEDRKEKNKSENGLIRIVIKQKSGKIQITFSDDGNGIDLEKIKLKAIREGYATATELEKLPDSAVLKFILLPGFSTKTLITEVSGRGVGLDVVKSQIEKMKGSIEIVSQLNKGTDFIIELPLTLATVRGLFVRSANYDFMFPSLSLSSLHTISINDFHSVEGDQVVIINKKTIPVRFLHEILQINAQPQQNKYFSGVLFSDNENDFMILVDEILEENDCVIKSLPAPFNELALYIGATLTGNGDLVPILNPSILLTLSKQYLSLPVKNKLTTKLEKQKNHILIVDDSITTRSLTANALIAAGYDVSSAGDGESAIKILNSTKIDCIVTDIVMPGMSGYDFTRYIKSNDKLKLLPVVIVSSKESDSERHEGIAAGADVYIVKSKFSTHELIHQIELLL